MKTTAGGKQKTTHRPNLPTMMKRLNPPWNGQQLPPNPKTKTPTSGHISKLTTYVAQHSHSQRARPRREPTDSELENNTSSNNPVYKRSRTTTTPLIPSKPPTNLQETNVDPPRTYDINRPPPGTDTIVTAGSNLRQLSDDHVPTG